MSEWGPLAALVGDWEGTGGLDTAFSHSEEQVINTPYFEKVEMKPFGPVANGDQQLWGLDYHSAMWRESEDIPFHTEVGYWLYDPATGEILRGFVVPRGITVLAGGQADADAKQFTMSARAGDPLYPIGENRYLAERASTRLYTVTVTLNDDDTWSYAETTLLQMTEIPGELAHNDANTLHRRN
ncbi:MAG: heme-binding beta-barrel domain-containing protein [Microthrixaceae bacterium]|nr:FABP family protein [Microthrixaceae bacterium]MCO5313183.1 heme-binding beta-barrel domain-containing protein [Microthrixaceae bacterium]HPB45905.1 heme-binding beta-barrel domain-containing protein [Microthrixaceae bacterium]